MSTAICPQADVDRDRLAFPISHIQQVFHRMRYATRIGKAELSMFSQVFGHRNIDQNRRDLGGRADSAIAGGDACHVRAVRRLTTLRLTLPFAGWKAGGG